VDKLLLEDIIARYKHLQHRGVLDNATTELRARNVSCGDDITIYLQVADGVVTAASFDGSLCSIATYGAELLLDTAIGQPVAALQNLTSAELLGARGASLLANPVRLKCFELAQVAAHRA
jgi:nitrogen fixation NifU-like protein